MATEITVWWQMLFSSKIIQLMKKSTIWLCRVDCPTLITLHLVSGPTSRHSRIRKCHWRYRGSAFLFWKSPHSMFSLCFAEFIRWYLLWDRFRPWIMSCDEPDRYLNDLILSKWPRKNDYILGAKLSTKPRKGFPWSYQSNVCRRNLLD